MYIVMVRYPGTAGFRFGSSSTDLDEAAHRLSIHTSTYGSETGCEGYIFDADAKIVTIEFQGGVNSSGEPYIFCPDCHARRVAYQPGAALCLGCFTARAATVHACHICDREKPGAYCLNCDKWVCAKHGYDKAHYQPDRIVCERCAALPAFQRKATARDRRRR